MGRLVGNLAPIQTETGLSTSSAVERIEAKLLEVEATLTRAMSRSQSLVRHDVLQNLDYDDAGHTGFASSAALTSGLAGKSNTGHRHESTVVALTIVAGTPNTVATDASAGDVFTLAVTSDFTLSAPTNAADGMKKVWRFTQDSTPRTMTLNSIFDFGADVTAFALSTGSGLVDYMGCIYSSASSKWHVVATSKGY